MSAGLLSAAPPNRPTRASLLPNHTAGTTCYCTGAPVAQTLPRLAWIVRRTARTSQIRARCAELGSCERRKHTCRLDSC
eukprot:4058053-Prymnesium_polylepis.1